MSSRYKGSQGSSARERRKSSSDLSSDISSGTRTQQVTDEPISEPSPVRSYKTDSISSDIKSSLETLNKIESNKRGLTQTTDKSQQNGELPDSLQAAEDGQKKNLSVSIEKPTKKYFRSCLRRKSTSLDSFFVTSKTKENKSNKGENSSQLAKEKKQEQIVAKVKSFFTAFKNKERSLWIRTRPVSSLNLDKPPPKYNTQLSLKRKIGANKLPSLKFASPVQSSKLNSELESTQHSHHLSVSKGRNSKNKSINGLSPPSPAPSDSLSNPAQHTFYVLDDNKSSKKRTSEQEAIQPRRVILKSVTSANTSFETNWESKTFNFEKFSTNTSNKNIIHLESQLPLTKEGGINNYGYEYENDGQGLRDNIDHHINIHSGVRQRSGDTENINFDSEDFKHSQRYTQQKYSKRRSDNIHLYDQNSKGRSIQRECLENLINFHSYENNPESLSRDFSSHHQLNRRVNQSKEHSCQLKSYESEPGTNEIDPVKQRKYHHADIEYDRQSSISSRKQPGKGPPHSEDHKKSHCDQLPCTGAHRRQSELTSQQVVPAESILGEDARKRQNAVKLEFSLQKYSEPEHSVKQRPDRPNQLNAALQKPVSNSYWKPNNLGYHLYLLSPAENEDFASDNTTSPEPLETDLGNKSRDESHRKYFPGYFQRPVLTQEYPETQDYCDQSQEYFQKVADRQCIERTPTHSLNHNKRRQSQHNFRNQRMGKMGSLEDHERKVIIEFCHLLEKSKQLFNGLRELPQYGHKQWHSYFGRTFDVYTKLWKFQQQHRSILDSKYGLKRWQIGEIASKIGQLYYHFYLRTSETAYLNEAFSFYSAIRGRSYYTKACKEDKCELMVKKLRYYARFIVVCLLLKKVKLVRDLIKELDRQIIEYGNTYDPDDQMEWTVVVDEVKAFLQAEPVVSVIHPDNYPIIFSHRLTKVTTPPVERSSQMTLSLQEVIIVGSSSHQVKFSELTMDMFRMLQSLEKEPTGEIQQIYDDSPRQRFNLTPSAFYNKGYNLEAGASHCENPHKYLLFKPTPNQILVYLASCCDDLPPNGALLVYMSAEGQIGTPSKHIEDGYDIGGLITTSKNDVHRESNKEQKGTQSKYRDVNSFHPGDLFPFTRRPLFVIIDSENSYVFQNMPRHFGQPLVILMSPLETPSSLHVSNTDSKQNGNLFTLFLHSPLTAFCHCCDIQTLSLVHWDKAQASVDTFLAEASLIVTRSRIDSQYISYMGDSFLRLLILRYVFCEVVLRMHRAFRTRAQLPRSSPIIPDDVLEHPALTRIIMDLAAHLQVRPHFLDTPAATVSVD